MTNNPYDKIGSVVERWCEEHIYAQMLVTISIGYEWEPPHEETHLLDFDMEKGELVWDSDWWEGQQHVELVGFTPLYKVKLEGEGEYARTGRHGRWNEESPDCLDGDSVYVCSVCGETWTLIEGTPLDNNMHYCPNCGCKMDGGEQG